MTPAERLLTVLRGGEVTPVPCSIYFNTNLRVQGHDCSRLEGRTALAIDLGVDPFVSVGLGHGTHAEVRSRTWIDEDVAGEFWPIFWQEWQTPSGTLRQGVRRNETCANWDHIHWNDAAASSMFEPLIKEAADVEAFRYLFQPLAEVDFNAWQIATAPSFDHARALGLPVIATYGQGLALHMFLMGAQNAVLFSVDEPEAFDSLASIGHEAAMRNIEYAHRAGVHVLKRFGGYEMCNFYNPEIWRRVCRPRLEREVARAHELGLAIFYRVVTGMEPLLEDIATIGFDAIEGGEPHLSRCSLEQWRDAFAGRAASWTGVSSPVLLGGDDPEAVRSEVRKAVEIFGRRGFVLGVTNSIRRHFPWANTLAMIDEWKRLGDG